MKKLVICLFFLIVIGIIGYVGYSYLFDSGIIDQTPLLALDGDKDMELTFGEDFKEPGFVATDYLGNDISSKVKCTYPKMEHSGKYVVKYEVTDHDITIESKRVVHVKHKAPDPEDADYGHGLPVLMYHNVYDPEDPPEKIDENYVATPVLKEQLQLLIDNNYYFPTWKEVRDYVDGKIALPKRSIVLTFDDCTKQFRENGIPILEEYPVHATSFVICKKTGKTVSEMNLDHVSFQSHSYDMHRDGGNIGHGGIFTALPYEEALADLKKSIDILGSSDAFAYPYGDYTEECRQVVEDAGFKLAFTTVNDMIYPGMDPLSLPRVRISRSMTQEDFLEAIGEEVKKENEK